MLGLLSAFVTLIYSRNDLISLLLSGLSDPQEKVEVLKGK